MPTKEIFPEDPIPIFLAHLWDMVNQNPGITIDKKGGWYRASQFSYHTLWPTRLAGPMSVSNGLHKILCNNLYICSPEDTIRHKGPDDSCKIRYFHLDPARIEKVCCAYGLSTADRDHIREGL